MARRYKQQNEELNNTLSTERSSLQTRLDEIQQGGNKIVLDSDERKKLIEQGRQEQKAESESLINELMAKVSVLILFFFYLVLYNVCLAYYTQVIFS